MRTRAQPTASPVVASKLADGMRQSVDGAGRTTIVVGEGSYELTSDLTLQVLALLDDVAEGRDVTVAPAALPIGTELASELLGVSRPWLTTLLDRGEIASTKTGSKRRIRLGDLLDYRRADDERRRQALTWEFLDEER